MQITLGAPSSRTAGAAWRTCTSCHRSRLCGRLVNGQGARFGPTGSPQPAGASKPPSGAGCRPRVPLPGCTPSPGGAEGAAQHLCAGWGGVRPAGRGAGRPPPLPVGCQVRAAAAHGAVGIAGAPVRSANAPPPRGHHTGALTGLGPCRPPKPQEVTSIPSDSQRGEGAQPRELCASCPKQGHHSGAGTPAAWATFFQPPPPLLFK